MTIKLGCDMRIFKWYNVKVLQCFFSDLLTDIAYAKVRYLSI